MKISWQVICMSALISGLCLGGQWGEEEVLADEPKAAEKTEKANTKPDEVPEELPPLSPEAEQTAEKLRQEFSEGTEPRKMLDAILEGSGMGPEEGWFTASRGATRFTWEALKTRLDGNGDEVISRDEFPGDDADFKRLDRQPPEGITAEDLDWSAHALSPNPGSMLFSMLDKDGNGKVTKEEFAAMFDRMAVDGQEFLSLDDVREKFSSPSNSNRLPQSSGPTRDVLLGGLLRQEIGAWATGPAVDDLAPDFTLRQQDENGELTLSKEIGPQPVVLVFGNFTCGPFRAQAGNIEALAKRYANRARFVMVYVREAHPKDGWRMESNDRRQIVIAQPQTDAERFTVATTCRKHLDLKIPMLVDTIDDKVGRAYSGMPSRLYVLDASGHIAYKSGRGPFGFKPAEMEQSLLWLLTDTNLANPKDAVPQQK